MTILIMGERIFRVKTSWANNGCHGLKEDLCDLPKPLGVAVLKHGRIFRVKYLVG